MTVQITPSVSATAVGAVAAAGATHLAVDLVGGGFAALLPTIAERLALSSTGVGVLVAVFSVSALGSQPLMGGLADRFNSRHVTAIAAVLAAAVLAAAAVVTSVLALLIVIVVGGLASAAFHPSGAILARRLGPGSPENSVAVFAAAGTVGLALGPIAALALADGARGWVLLLAVPALVLAPLIWWGSRAMTPGGFLPREPQTAKRVLVRGEVPKLVASATLVAIASTSIASTLPRWIADEPGRGTTDPAIGVALATFSLAAAAGGVAGGRLANRVGSARLLRVSLLAAAFPAGALAFATPATAASFLALLLTGFLIGPAIPLLLVAAQNEVPERAATASGMIMGLSHGLAGVAFIGVSVIIGTAGYGAGVLTGAVALIPAAFIVRARVGDVGTSITDTARCVIASCRCLVNGPDPDLPLAS
ncbi:MAG TPA: MFS transporter [Ilumatobacteraceae bacterium]|nr:MFS transporter [Ilumatobacteraceae bacterium]